MLALTITAADPRRGELARARQIARHDRIGMLRAVTVDVLDRFVQRIHDADRDHRPQVFRGVIRRRGLCGVRDQFARALVAANLDAALQKLLAGAGQELLRDLA